MPLPFAIYCSGGATSLQAIYNSTLNREKIMPGLVIYDGQDEDTLQKLDSLFGEILEVFNPSVFEEKLQPKPHTMVSLFIEQKMKAYGIERLICIGEKILKKQLIEAFPKGLINIHPALLPSFKGLKAIDQALATGVSFLGITAHYIDQGIDTGPIVAQVAMFREDFEDYPDVTELNGALLKLILRDWANISLSRTEITHELKNRNKPYFLPQKGRF
jgi:phosphoribosylglycinamide formyltransferase-1